MPTPPSQWASTVHSAEVEDVRFVRLLQQTFSILASHPHAESSSRTAIPKD
ncbi:hypothetical protein CC1G_10388 [Coprinopsis cinerea okayama7|uniref:Uncharacterized protein n=1 Tax=Coprinopsis cinerea (strain Okayama-7 / 130 / ATCC MYA-4618 / FGSC 9003) TaxID=240176 RepID=A8PAL1_COPC7|nr:hypothetical protein CC1G_10388 [Coprinopsis cinerea okayama7\|eukprot:XP_001840004.2 hypothetical protein CC1G_10388 [Coprinopsis cinerea okayama7\